MNIRCEEWRPQATGRAHKDVPNTCLTSGTNKGGVLDLHTFCTEFSGWRISRPRRVWLLWCQLREISSFGLLSVLQAHLLHWTSLKEFILSFSINWCKQGSKGNGTGLSARGCTSVNEGCYRVNFIEHLAYSLRSLCKSPSGRAVILMVLFFFF
jgi:hypothetical protein